MDPVIQEITREERGPATNEAPPDPAPEPERPRARTSPSRSDGSKRLVVELTVRASADLAWLVDVEESNRTTVVNRAVQVYKMVMEAQLKGQRLIIADSDSSRAEAIYIV